MKKYNDFESALEFLLDYGFEFCNDSATGRHKCYKNEYGEIVLRYKQLDPNYYVPQICIEINYWKKVIDIDKEFVQISKKKSTMFYDMVHEVINNQINKNNKIFDLRINPQYHNQINYLRIINNLEIIDEIDNVALKGKLKCNCGCNEFYIYHTGKQTKGILFSDIVKHKKQVVINAQCVNCKEIIKIFDSTIDGIKPINAKQYEFKKLVLKKDIDRFKITMMYNYYKEDYKTNKFVECFIDVESAKLKKNKRIFEK